tara:strand:+ start:1571 stop:2152 length:582 start_codon:yes stop_codon:yes gene_type:complete
MKKIFILIVSFIVMSFIASHQDHVDVNTESSKIRWKGSKISESHDGIVNIKQGKLILEHGRLVGGGFVIDMNTISTQDMSDKGNNKLNSHLRNEDFFDVENFPTSKLLIKSTKSISKDVYRITADLTIKGITNSIVFDTEIKISGIEYLATAKIKIDRTKWDIKYKSGSIFADLGDKAILDEIEFDVMLLSVK